MALLRCVLLCLDLTSIHEPSLCCTVATCGDGVCIGGQIRTRVAGRKAYTHTQAQGTEAKQTASSTNMSSDTRRAHGGRDRGRTQRKLKMDGLHLRVPSPCCVVLRVACSAWLLCVWLCGCCCVPSCFLCVLCCVRVPASANGA